MFSPSKLASFFLVLVLLSSSVSASQKKCAADPYASPSTDPCNILGYIASNSMTTVALVAYLVIGICQAVSIWKFGTKWMMSMTIGIFSFCFGLVTRYALHGNPQSKNIFIAEYLLIVLSPCLFIATEYVLLSRLATYLNRPTYMWISPRRVTLVYVVSDVTTFLVQMAGAVITVTGDDENQKEMGSNIFLTGLILQLVSFIIFTIMYLRFLQLVYRNDRQVWNKDVNRKMPWYEDWRALAAAFFLSCILIIIRCTFRVVEEAYGFKGFIARSEAAFYIFDCLPLFIAVAVYVPFWPGRFITEEYQPVGEDSTRYSMLQRPDSLA
ncbi:RTA1-domain-containing [Pyrrhoderma noxium]|uniref:RTA1-domain-containing n=1 Tax=Pyrrhoderma noxium TaxID=2282107 RepID=A0A286UVN4_9AGAM|nr:RTA1-domain-containing [Pyrrhoderma noxium]